VAASSATHDVPWTRISGAAAIDSRGGTVDTAAGARGTDDAAARAGAPVVVDPYKFRAPAAEESALTKEGDGCLMSSLDVCAKVPKTFWLCQCSTNSKSRKEL
jgi:hypothetical protein